MSIYQEIITILGLLGLGGVITTLVTYLLNRRQRQQEQMFNIKKDAFIRAIHAISGLRENIIVELKRNQEEDSPEAMLDYLVQFKKEIATTKLFATNEVNLLLGDVDDLVVELSYILNEASKEEKQAQHQNQPLEQKFQTWLDTATELEEKLIIAMQHDLHIN